MKFSTRLQIALSLLFGRFSQWKKCANRLEATALSPSGHEIKVIFRRTWEKDGYSREELLEMLTCVRKHQRQQNQDAEYIAHIELCAAEDAAKE